MFHYLGLSILKFVVIIFKILQSFFDIVLDIFVFKIYICFKRTKGRSQVALLVLMFFYAIDVKFTIIDLDFYFSSPSKSNRNKEKIDVLHSFLKLIVYHLIELAFIKLFVVHFQKNKIYCL